MRVGNEKGKVRAVLLDEPRLSSLDIVDNLERARVIRREARRLLLELQQLRLKTDEALALSQDAREFRRADDPGAELLL